MSNPLTAVGHAVKTAAVDITTGVVDVFEFLPKAERVFASAIKDQPEVKSAILQLVQRAETVVADTGTAAADQGVNLAADAKTLADAEAFFAWFRNTFIPLVEQIYSEVKQDLSSPAPSTPAA